MLRLIVIALMLLCPICAAAEQATEAEIITACSQNLARFGEKTKKQSDLERAKQLSYLVGRMREAHCDFVAVQEVIGSTKFEAAATLQEIAIALSARSGRRFVSIVGDGRDKFIRNGYLIDQDLFKIVQVVSFGSDALPRYRTVAPPNFFERAPLGVMLRLVKASVGTKQLFVINNHFKSKAFGNRDSSGLDFELIRMQEAEAVRKIVESQLTKEQGAAVVVVLGDRNSGIDSASSAVIEGEYLLKDFMSDFCVVEQNGHPACKASGSDDRVLRGLFEYRQQQFPGKYRGGSYRYRGKEEYLDEIFLRPNELNRALDDQKRVRIGTGGDYFRGSDHKLVWAEIKLN